MSILQDLKSILLFMLYVCHTTPTQNGSICRPFVRLATTNGRCYWPKDGKCGLLLINMEEFSINSMY